VKDPTQAAKVPLRRSYPRMRDKDVVRPNQTV
jgi:hypothetical protein